MNDTKLEFFTFGGAGKGPSLTALGAVHGNEECGPIAINRLIKHIEAGDVEIVAGELTLVPVCNPRAREQGVRFIERNLNRFMYPKDAPEAYEDHLDNQLCPVLEKTDYLLDFHSYSSKGNAFMFLGALNERNLSFARSLELPRYIYGWADAMGGNKDLKDKRQAWGTTEYTREHGGVGITVECGHHTNEEAPDVAFMTILNALEFLGMAEIKKDLKENFSGHGCYHIKMRGAFLKLREGYFVQEWRNMHPVKEGAVIARYDDGEELTMPADGYIVLPMYDPTIGDQWFFWGVEEEF